MSLQHPLANILNLLVSSAFSTTQLFSSLSQTCRRLNAAGENHKTTQRCANKNSQFPISALLSNPFPCPWSALSLLFHRDNPIIFYYFESPLPTFCPSVLLGGRTAYFTQKFEVLRHEFYQHPYPKCTSLFPFSFSGRGIHSPVFA